ncbi:copper resistance protein CopC [Mycolicibacterium aromaticivorans JS19b1 = JCM 16368]|uniref:Copper resistance protein CopC n=1 Tax=Mycolicibacterium aromaticivorans JS19b1 = JCM 16368 TaxID=1440774 RepID=A0A064CE76_9MYCO|nr:copper resistance CopC family protein [Mycolicibacterium aromaticivorans]KDE97028.1 copper resistance protein CopC [Mycolicibacterium aromaticivorans JS19b1 = JCM 16368]
MRTFATTLVALTLWWLAAGIAAAHTGLVSSDPTTDATVTIPPGVVTLTFSEDINPAFATIVVNSADGRNWITGPPRVEGPQVTATMGPDRPASGVYTVGYRVVSADGHPVSGSYKFTIAGVPGGTQPAATVSEAAPTAASAPQSPSPAGSDTKTSILIAAVAGLVLGGVIALWQSWRRRRARAPLSEAGSADSATPGDEARTPPSG